MNNEIIFLKPIFVQKPWGGDLLKSFFPNINESKIGEAWLFSCLKDNSNPILNPDLKGLTIYDLYNKHKELFGIDEPFFPIMIKMIGACENLSIQVHPEPVLSSNIDDRYLGKDESWYILFGKNKIKYGLKKDKDFLATNLSSNYSNKSALFKDKKVKKGDIIDIPNGTVHALSSGLVVYEVQTTSDITYRLYDYDRAGLDGKPRDLHLIDGIKSINENQLDTKLKKHEIKSNGNIYTHLIKNEHYTLSRLDLKNKVELINNSFIIISVIDGEALLNDTKINKGDTLMVTTKIKQVSLTGNATLLITTK